MSTATAIAAPPSQRQCFQLSNVDWKTYTQLLRIFEERPGYRLSYDRGELEIVTPLIMHEDDSSFLHDMIVVLAEELELPLKRSGSATLRQRLKQRGIEADDCVWIANAARMAGVRRLDLRIHPPPDLAVEIDVTNSSLDRLGIYATLKVPEVWRLEEDQLSFLILGSNGTYAAVSHSKAFPLIVPTDLIGFIQQARAAGDQNPILRQFRMWVRQRVGTP